MKSNTQLPAEVLERIDKEARQYAFYNYVTAANDAKFEDVETWPKYAQVAYYSIKYFMEGDVNCWPYTSKTLAMEYATKLHELQQKYDDILANESGFESKTENVWQSGYASGHEAASEKVNALKAKCEKYDELYRLCFSNFAKLRARCQDNERMVSMGDNIRAIIEDVTNKMLAMPQPDNTGHEPFLVQSASEALSGEGEKEVENEP